MLCPDDQTPLVLSERQGVEIDYCPRCRGVWLDRGELDKLIQRSIGAPPAGDVAVAAAGGLVPPTQVLAVQGDDGVWQDVHGVGAASPAHAVASAGAAQNAVGYSPPARLAVAKRRSWLEELFDF